MPGDVARAKIVAFCLAAGCTATVCINGARQLEHRAPAPKVHHADKPKRTARIVEPDRAAVTVVRRAPARTKPHVAPRRVVAVKKKETP